MAPFSSCPPLFFLFLYFGASLTPINGEPIHSLPTLTPLSFHDAYTQLFGDSNLALRRGGRRVHIALDRRTGAGFASRGLYLHGFFSAAIKLPSDHAAGVVVAFYTHDELDFEFLGNIRGREWRVQTNVYGNGSTSIGREERYSLWFDPTEDFHQYAILWSSSRIIFYIDGIPIREVVRTQAMDGLGQFPSKPMSLYATIWDGSSWATSGGRYKVNYKYAPYVAEFTDLVLRGCATDLTTHQPTCRQADIDMYDTVSLSVEQRLAMDDFREKHMTYGYCYDRLRYTNPPAECSTGREADLFLESGEARGFSDRRRHRYAKRHYRTALDDAF
ncbi:putative xyloglucan endotransglucosylase/hydrolase protein 28 [Ananas comosus]|uniref:Xyloglucan endotransglucosylase/hydrolase n=1 Tax=Ananas comosus TaxID=4615 RepID=A0A199V077_ANACO|nr:putative xyloglucan endotransglucosylase/hydrolase protein 28 [Ananas comosus]